MKHLRTELDHLLQHALIRPSIIPATGSGAHPFVKKFAIRRLLVVVAASDQDISTCEDILEIKLKWENLTSSPDRDFQHPRRDVVSTEIDVCIAESVASNNMKQAKGCFKAYDNNDSMENGNSNSNGRQGTVSKERVGAGMKDTGKLTKKPVKALSCIETDK
ncbi:hypothetical protein Tco_1160506 [Tanacetum coccineum]